jgi:hypothetical protein
MLIVFSVFLLLAATPLTGTGAAVWILAVSQLLLLVNEIRKGQVTGAGAFLFMSFLFFGMRPIYLLIEKDYRLLVKLFLVGVDWDKITDAMWWATLAAICFSLGAQLAPRLHGIRFMRRRQRNLASVSRMIRPTNPMVATLLFGQLMSLLVMLVLARSGRGLYGSGFGAYLYELPVPLQAVQVIAVVVFTQQFLRERTPFNLFLLAGGGMFLLAFTWAMRDVSNFRGFYLTGLVITGLAVAHLIKTRVSYAWLIVPIIIVLPFFQYLGAQRTKTNEEMAEQDVVEEVFKDEGLLMSYWRFYGARAGDMNIFDTFVAATQAEVKKRPYVMAWLYVPLHLVPRALWEGKPRKGIVQDVSFTRGAPMSPGIAGFFLLDGGKLWMLGSMALLGYLISCLDYFVLTMRIGFVRAILMGVIVTNGMFLTRVFLWQYFYQVLYMIIPLAMFMWIFRTRNTMSQTVTRRRSRGFLGQAR